MLMNINNSIIIFLLYYLYRLLYMKCTRLDNIYTSLYNVLISYIYFFKSYIGLIYIKAT